MIFLIGCDIIVGKFYRYIYKKYNGYQILKDNIHYGWYDDIRWALFDRDRLEACDWDFEEFVWLPERDNPYLTMRLPPKELDNWRQYVYHHDNSFRIQKKINGKLKYFGTYPTLEEALDVRDELIKNDWKII